MLPPNARGWGPAAAARQQLPPSSMGIFIDLRLCLCSARTLTRISHTHWRSPQSVRVPGATQSDPRGDAALAGRAAARSQELIDNLESAKEELRNA